MSLASPSLSERVVSALLAGVFGAVLGAVLAWLLGIYSNTLGPAFMEVSFAQWVGGGAVVFAVLGAVFGTAMGGFIGDCISAIVAFERLDGDRNPWWIILALIVGVVIFLVWARQALGSA